MASMSKNPKDVKGMSLEVPSASPIDMLAVLSHIIVKVPLSKLLIKPEHRDKAIAWVGGVDEKASHDHNLSQNPKEEDGKMETDGVVSQIPPMFLDVSVNQCPRSVEPFFLSIIVNGKNLKNCKIDFGASNIVMPYEVMK